MNPMAQKLAELREEWAGCTKCGLSKTRTKLVFGEGNSNAHILIIGEAPGAKEDETGKPFRGEAGGVLNNFLKIAKLDRDVDLFITNVVCCRPTAKVKDDRTGEDRIENRPPTKTEREACRDRLMRTLYYVDPLLIITIGKVPYQALFGKAPIISSVRGRMQTLHHPGVHGDLRYAVMPMYHTAFLFRTHDSRPEGPWGRTWSDWVQVCRVIDYLREVYFGTPPPTRGEASDDEEGEQRRSRKSGRSVSGR